MRRWRRGRWCGNSIYSLRFHQFNARAVRIINVQLPFAVDAGLNFQRLRVTDAYRALFQNGLGLFDVRDSEAKVMLLAAFVRVGEFGVEHEFKKPLPVGNLLVNPAQHGGIFSAAPDFMKAEDAFVK